MNSSSSIQLRLGDLLHAIAKNKKMILMMTIAGLVIGIALSALSFLRGEMAKQYLITASAVITSENGGGNYPASNASYPRNEDITIANNMVDSAIYVLQSDLSLNTLITQMDLIGITPKDISNNLALKQYGTTRIIEMSLYWRSAEEGVKILQTLTAQAKELFQETLGIGGMTVINEPTSKYLIGGSLNASIWVYMTMIGLILGVCISALQILIQPTLTNVRDVNTLFGLETLGTIPDDAGWFGQSKVSLTSSGAGSEIVEELSSTAHILRNRLGSGVHKCIYVTSASHNEGKTVVAANLAVALSDLGYRVLLIDFDFRNPTLGSMFLDTVEYERSLNALYRGDINETEAITTLTGYLDLLPTVVERRGIMMDETTMNLVKRLAQNYDYVLMDTPPVGMVADAMSLNQVADSVLFVVRYDSATIPVIRDALERLDKSGTRVVGCVVNGVSTSSRRSEDDTDASARKNAKGKKK
ncbi:MAG: AAA family ATPase [Clostridia bacterium]|nr:AAA family ATPase [Clostridia bacterium]